MITAEAVDPGKRAAAQCLDVIAGLFERLHADGIRYCHWKSNEHLAASLLGTTDLDLLVDRDDAAAFHSAVSDLGYKRFVAPPGRGYPGVQDYLGLDPDTGALVHLHVHYQLTLGAKFLKGHRLPWERRILATRVFDDTHGVYIAEPHVETLLLLVRLALKVRARDHLFAALGRPVVDDSAFRELCWLAERVETERLGQISREFLGVRSASIALELVAGDRPKVSQLAALRRHAEPSLSEYGLYGGLETVARAWLREGVIRSTTNRFFGGARSKRIVPEGGLTVALIGPDGGGKSTIARHLLAWLSRYVAVVGMYGGSGQGSASPPRLALRWAGARLRPLLGWDRDNTAPADAPVPRVLPTRSEPSRLRQFGRLLWAVSLAHEQRQKARRARRARARCMVVVADRIPQSQFPGVNDGPRLTEWLERGGGLRPAAARWELRAFRDIEAVPPDLVVKLNVTAEVSLRRKSDTPVEQLRQKIEVVQELEFPASTRVVSVDATQPLDHVLLAVKRAVWASL